MDILYTVYTLYIEEFGVRQHRNSMSGGKGNNLSSMKRKICFNPRAFSDSPLPSGGTQETCFASFVPLNDSGGLLKARG